MRVNLNDKTKNNTEYSNNFNKIENNNYQMNTDNNYSDSLQNSENGNIKIFKSELPNYLNDTQNKKFELEKFFNEVHYNRNNQNEFIIFIKDKIVNCIDYSKIFILNNKNFFILQIPFENNKSHLFRVDYGEDCIMKNYTIELTEDILKIIINIENNSENKKILRLKKLNKIIMFKLFFKYFQKKKSNKIIYESARYYHNKKLKNKILNVLKLFYYIKIKDNVVNHKLKKLILKKTNFFAEVKNIFKIKEAYNLFFKFRFLKFNLLVLKSKISSRKEKVINKKNSFIEKKNYFKNFKENLIKEKFLNLLKKLLQCNHSKIAFFLSDFLTKKKLFRILKDNLIKYQEKNNFSLEIYKRKIKKKFLKNLFKIKHAMRKFYYNSSKYNYLNHFFIFLIIQKFINLTYNKISGFNFKNNKLNNLDTINEDNFPSIINDNIINDKNFNNTFDSNSLLESYRKIYIFNLNSNFKLKINFKNYIFSNYYNNNFHYPIVKKIFNIIKENWKNSTRIVKNFWIIIVSKKIKFSKEKKFDKIKNTKKNLKQHITSQRKLFLNRLKIKINQKKLKKFINQETKKKIKKLLLMNNFINFLNQINRKTKLRNYFLCKQKYFDNKLLRFRFFQFLSCLYMKRKIEKKKKHENSDSRILIQSIKQNNKNPDDFEYKYYTRLISPKNYVADLNSRFYNFRKNLNLRLNYFKLIINCKREKIIKRKTLKFKENCLKIYKSYFKKIKNLLHFRKQIKFTKQKIFGRFFSVIFNRIKYKKTNFLLRENKIINSKKLSFVSLKEYYLYKKDKNKKQNYYKKILNSLYYKYYYENYFLKSAEILKSKKYLLEKLNNIQVKNVFKKLEKNSKRKKIIIMGRNYLIKNNLTLCLVMINKKNKEKNLSKIFNNKMKKYFFRLLLRSLKKLKIIKKINLKKKILVNKIKKFSFIKFVNLIYSNKARKKIKINQIEKYFKKISINRFKNFLISKNVKNKKYKKFFGKLLIKKTKCIILTKNNKIKKIQILKSSFKQNMITKHMFVMNIISKISKFNFILKKIFLKFIKGYYYSFSGFLKEKDRGSFIKNKIKTIRIKEFFKLIFSKKIYNQINNQKIKKLKLKNHLKNLLKNILQNLICSQSKKELKEKIKIFVTLKNFPKFKKNCKYNKKTNFLNSSINKFFKFKKLHHLNKFLHIIKFKIKILAIKKISLYYFKKSISEVYAKLQKNLFIKNQSKISKTLSLNYIFKNFIKLKSNIKKNSFLRLLYLKKETYKYKFQINNNFKKFFENVKKKVFYKVNYKNDSNYKKGKFFKFFDHTQDYLQFNINKFLEIEKIKNFNSFKIFFKKIQKKISNKNFCIDFNYNRQKNLFIAIARKFINEIKSNSSKINGLKISYFKYLKSNLLKFLIKLKNEKINISTQTENSIMRSYSILNYSKSTKIKIMNFFKRTKKDRFIKKSFGKFYDFKIIYECKIFLKKLIINLEKFKLEKYLSNYLKIKKKILYHKFFICRMQKQLNSKKSKYLIKKQKIFEILKNFAKNQKELKEYLQEATNIK